MRLKLKLFLAALDQRNDEYHQKHDEQNAGNFQGNALDAKQAERAREQTDEQKNQDVIKHKFI
jgi:hypothetical protein